MIPRGKSSLLIDVLLFAIVIIILSFTRYSAYPAIEGFWAVEDYPKLQAEEGQLRFNGDTHYFFGKDGAFKSITNYHGDKVTEVVERSFVIIRNISHAVEIDVSNVPINSNLVFRLLSQKIMSGKIEFKSSESAILTWTSSNRVPEVVQITKVPKVSMYK